MSRLRIRMELNRGGVGVPLQKMAHIVDEAAKFFRMLGEDVHIDQSSGEWLGHDFENKSLNFTAEFVGPVTPAQIREFHAAFDGVTLMRRATIAQFARIADAIEGDELIGFGLYQSDDETDPVEWRSLSKREALRITEEIHLLLERAGEPPAESRLPAALDTEAASIVFKDRREHGGLADRIARLESEVSRHGESINVLRDATTSTEDNLQKLLVTVDAFCDRATRQIERLPAPAPPPSAQETAAFRWAIPIVVAVVCAVAGVILYRGSSDTSPAAVRAQAADPVASAPAPSAPAAAPAPTAQPEPPAATVEPADATLARVELKAVEPSWVVINIAGKESFAKLLGAGESKIVDSEQPIRVQIGNAGGVEVQANGKAVKSLGRRGQVRVFEVTPQGFHFVPM